MHVQTYCIDSRTRTHRLTYTQEVRTTMSEAGRTNIIMISSNNGHSYLLVEAAGCTWRELDEFLSTEEEADAAGESDTKATTAHKGRDGKPRLHQSQNTAGCWLVLLSIKYLNAALFSRDLCGLCRSTSGLGGRT